jgi:hypothetical protein
LGGEKQHQMGKQERARFRIMKNLQHRSDARAWVVHRNFDPVFIGRTLKVDGAMVRRSLNLKARRDTKKGSSRCMKGSVIQRGLRHSTIAISALMELLLTDIAKPNAKRSTTRDNNTKWDVGEGKADTPRDSSHCQKELLSCGMAREDVTVLVIRLS